MRLFLTIIGSLIILLTSTLQAKPHLLCQNLFINSTAFNSIQIKDTQFYIDTLKALDENKSQLKKENPSYILPKTNDKFEAWLQAKYDKFFKGPIDYVKVEGELDPLKAEDIKKQLIDDLEIFDKYDFKDNRMHLKYANAHLILLSSFYFKALGIDHRIYVNFPSNPVERDAVYRGESSLREIFIEIEPNNKTRINQIAKDYFKHQESNLWYSPELLKRHKARGIHKEKTIGEPGGIYLGSETFLEIQRLSKDAVFIHELIHSTGRLFVKNKKNQPFLGFSEKGTRLLPGPTGYYESFQGHDEAFTYYVSVRFLLRNILNSISHEKFQPQDLIDIQRVALLGIHVAQRNQDIVNELFKSDLKKITLFHDTIYVVLHDKYTPYTEALIRVRNEILDAPEFSTHFPLVQSKGKDDPNNMQYLLEQLNLLKTESASVQTELELAYEYIQKLMSQENPSPETIYYSIRQLLGSLSKTKEYVNYSPLKESLNHE